MVIVHWASRVMEFSAKISMRYLSSFMSLVVVRALSIVQGALRTLDGLSLGQSV